MKNKKCSTNLHDDQDLSPGVVEDVVRGHVRGQNLLPAFESTDYKSLRGWALIGRETHVNTARGGLPYPMRAIRTEDFLYIINFKPERAPMGDALKGAEASFEQIENNTRLTYADVDAGPTKAWMFEHRDDPEVKKLWDLGFGPRPEEELYDLTNDPHQMNNLAGSSSYNDTRQGFREILMNQLKESNDPRLEGETFDEPPYNKRTKPGQTSR